ncbi:hypothetical protein BKA66DRAFT_17098 [Pyrenochaeta sp. MPI-SDFR-AT-0127]|nr:hypothetical protein BKA66DRAFT_17098 [Pyrenochaeta sp. MPI-SDFR-AT-0127]
MTPGCRVPSPNGHQVVHSCLSSPACPHVFHHLQHPKYYYSLSITISFSLCACCLYVYGLSSIPIQVHLPRPLIPLLSYTMPTTASALCTHHAVIPSARFSFVHKS